MALAHSVQEEHNFVSSWHAGWYGINASFDVAMESLGISHSIAVDPRLTTSEDEVFHTFWSIEGDLGGDQVMRGDGRPSQQACSDAARLGVEHLGQDLVLSDCSDAESCTAGQGCFSFGSCTGSEVCLQPAVSCLHRRRHPLPFKVSFADSAGAYRNVGRRDFSACTLRPPSTVPACSEASNIAFPRCRKVGATSEPTADCSRPLPLCSSWPAQLHGSWAQHVNRLGASLAQHFASRQAPHQTVQSHSVDALSQQSWSLACTAIVPPASPCTQVCAGPGPESREASRGLAAQNHSVEALSQQLRSLAGTAPVPPNCLQVCTGPGFPGTGLQQTDSKDAALPTWLFGPCSFSDIRLRITATVDIFPPELDRPEIRQQQLSGLSWLSGWRVGGSVCSEAQQDRYALLATDRHLQLRTMRRGWSINELVSDIVGVVPRVRSVRFLVHRLPHLPAVQAVVTTREAAATDSAVPLDFREVQGRICTLHIGPGTPNAVLARQVFEECPATHSPRQDFQLLLPDGGVLQVFPAHADWPDYVRGAPGVPALWPQQPEIAAEDNDDQVNLLQVAPGRALGSPVAACSGGKASPCLASLVLTPPRCPVSGGDPPSLLKRRLSGEPSKAARDRWQLHPQTLSEPRFSGMAVAYLTWGKPDDTTRHLFTVFDSRRHVSAITSNDAARIADFAQRAIDTAPGPVRALQFLTVPVPGLPLPQVVLTFVTDPADTLAIPWDCREIGLPIRTVPHSPGEQLRQAAASLQNTVRHEPDLALRISEGRLLVFDVAGLVQEALPVVLTETQWLRVESPIWNDANADSHFRLPSMLASLRLGAPAGLHGSPSTTSTTTGMQAAGVHTFRIRLFGDGKEVSHDVQSPCPQLDLVLCLLLGKMQQLTPPTRGPTNVMMAKAQPSPLEAFKKFCSLVMRLTNSTQLLFSLMADLKVVR